MKKPISIKSLLTNEERKVSNIVAELEASDGESRAAAWTARLSPSVKGGKCQVP